MTASSVRVDRVLEGDGGLRADLVDDRAGVHVEELEAAELAGADLALGYVEQRRLCRRLAAVDHLPAELPFGHAASLSNRCSISQGRDNAAVARLSDDEIRSGLAGLAGWARSDDEIQKTYELASFPDAIAFVTRVGLLAERETDHPARALRWEKV